MLTEAELSEYVDRHMGASVFRMETRERYTVDTDAGNVARYLGGEPAPSMAVKGPWLERLRQERVEGRHRSRVHIVHSPLSDYLRYEFEWGYTYTVAAGEEISILDLATTTRPTDVPDEDFLILDDVHVVLMHYDRDDRFVGAEPLPRSDLATYRRRRDAAWAVAVPFDAYWAGRPQDWRANWLPASD